MQIIVLLLSEDDGFAKTVFKVRLQRVPWFTERSHFGLSLGDLMVSVLLKSSFRNTSVAQDEYLHSNALSALINLVPHATHISSNTAQRLCFIIEGAHKRLIWLDHKVCPFISAASSCLLHVMSWQKGPDCMRLALVSSP